jgi:hypothetical protein
VAVLWFPVIVAAAVLLSRRWPIAMRRVSLCLAYAIGTTLLCIAVSGLAHNWRPAAMAHRWLPHGLLIVAWNAIPFAIGVTLAGIRLRPAVATARSLGLLLLLAALFVASFTGYLGPSYGPMDVMTLDRFRVLHYIVCPPLSIALSIGWYHGLDADGRPRPLDHEQHRVEG